MPYLHERFRGNTLLRNSKGEDETRRMNQDEMEKILLGRAMLMAIIMMFIFIVTLVVIGFIPEYHANGYSCEYDESLCVLGIPDPDFCDSWQSDEYPFGPDDICFD